jgi:hypothetical protein
MPRGRPGKSDDDVLLKSAELLGWALGGLEREIVQTRELVASSGAAISKCSSSIAVVGSFEPSGGGLGTHRRDSVTVVTGPRTCTQRAVVGRRATACSEIGVRGTLILVGASLIAVAGRLVVVRPRLVLIARRLVAVARRGSELRPA